MLGTRERTLLLDSLRPPPGYRLRRAVGTSFTLDLMALLTAPLAFTFFDAHDQDGAPVADPVALLEALRRHAEKITLFCQAGAIGVPGPDQPLLAYLEGSVIEVQPRQEGGIFHPKLWVLNFQAEERPAIYRVLCLSRNLTFARTWDTCLRLQGRLVTRQRGFGRNKPFADLLLALPKLATRSVTAESREDLKRMAYEIRRVKFQTPGSFQDFRVHNFGLGRRRGWPFPKGGRGLVVSPFISGSTVRNLVHDHGLDVLISRPEAFEDVARGTGREVLPTECYVLSSAADLNSRDGEEEKPQDGSPPLENEVELSGLHAKLFLFENGRESHLFAGSANATDAAFRSNMEVLVELVGRTKDCGIASFLGPEDDPRLETIRSLLQSYRLPDCLGPEPPESKSKERVDRLARILAAVPLTAKVCEIDEGHRWDMRLSGVFTGFPAGVEVKVWPATLSAEAAQRIADPAGQRDETDGWTNDPMDPVAIFKGLSFEALTTFFAFEVSLREESHKVRRRFVATAELIGAPENRRERLLRSLLKDRRRVIQLLFLILMGEGADVSVFVRAAKDGEDAFRGSFGGWDREALLEALLRCLSHKPTRIDEAAALIADLTRTPEGEDLLPEGLNEIWEPVWAARQELE